MIDLRKALPTTIAVNGKAFSVKTDYRIWLEFGEIVRGIRNGDIDGTEDLLHFIFVDSIPSGFFESALEFYTNTNITPVMENDGDSTRPILDFVQDGEFIYSSFLEQYHIDITETDIHWHKFQALFRGLSQKSKLGEIMSYRGFSESSDDEITMYKKLKKAWQLPQEFTKEEREAIAASDKWMEDTFGIE